MHLLEKLDLPFPCDARSGHGFQNTTSIILTRSPRLRLLKLLGNFLPTLTCPGRTIVQVPHRCCAGWHWADASSSNVARLSARPRRREKHHEFPRKHLCCQSTLIDPLAPCFAHDAHRPVNAGDRIVHSTRRSDTQILGCPHCASPRVADGDLSS